ncbi:MAG: serine/threonine-protein phosphatase [Clostridiales bacterium]|jgi:serine/threonine protein phosphatase PrpC|nr:serine/threonine-protein phosphatase [Clostridiales bacterium]
MAKRKQVNASVLSHMGCERGNNEDNFFFNGDYMAMDSMDKGAWIDESFSESVQLYAVCDGMGGAQYGERASTMTVRKMSPLLVKAGSGDLDALVDAFCREASDEVNEDGGKQGAKYQGTTLAMVVLRRNMAHVYNVGDSRVYLLRGKGIRQLSRDHSEVSRMVDAGLLTREQAQKHPRANVISQYIGIDPGEKPKDFVYAHKENLFRHDRLLLCSDGISDLLTDSEILRISLENPSAKDVVKNLSLRAMELSGKDNMTTIVLDLQRGYPQGAQTGR